MSAVLDAVLALPPWLVLALVFALPALEASLFVGLVVPGEAAVVLGGVVAHGGGVPLWAVIVAAFAGAVVGDQIGFTVGRRYGPVLLNRLPARVDRPGQIKRALALVDRRGAAAVVVGRWTAVLRALVPGIAGMSGMRRWRFFVANVVGALLWAVGISVAGYVAGASYRVLEERLGLGGEVLLGLVALLAAVWLVRARRSPDRRSKGTS